MLCYVTLRLCCVVVIAVVVVDDPHLPALVTANPMQAEVHINPHTDTATTSNVVNYCRSDQAPTA